MRPFKFYILILFIVACSTKHADKNIDNKIELVKSPFVTDSCLNNLNIDNHRVESLTFKNFWFAAEKLGYKFNDDTIVPFVKIIFQPKSSKFYSDTLKILSCNIFDSVNIHKIIIYSSKPVDKNYYANLNVEEWQFKTSGAAVTYATALGEYFKKGYGVKSPTAVLQTNHSVYIFETAAYIFIPEMEKMEKVLDHNIKIYGTNY